VLAWKTIAHLQAVLIFFTVDSVMP